MYCIEQWVGTWHSTVCSSTPTAVFESCALRPLQRPTAPSWMLSYPNSVQRFTTGLRNSGLWLRKLRGSTLEAKPHDQESPMKDQVRYSELRRQASEETDPKKLIELV